jgi:hypothetical protein
MGFRTCPRCSEPIHEGQPSCPVCDFSLSQVDSAFGSRRVRVQRLVDASQTINPDELEQLGQRIDRFELDFPQLVFAAYIADLPESTNLRELGFWMINRAIFDSPRSNDSAILLCINNRFLSASITLGYVPEQFLSEEAITWTLDRTMPYLGGRQFGRMIASCLNSLSWQLRQPTEAS